jgi:mRNA-degrading endonuclease RelE of RelBE toxin-antitoxin system
MNRFHKTIYFPDIQALSVLNERLNSLNWKYSVHALDNLKYRVINQYALLSHIKELQLNKDDIFEYYKRDDGFIEKVCYRLHFGEYDVILVLTWQKEIVTIYLNAKEDNHLTLKKEVYYSVR